ncbi:MAG: hypothetical protein N4J56_007728 [Chroococcidiopsis sp. SAG 2025]|nr:hypothetical protein [Chroococcidiopsis sp. SAG 2025]
MQEESFEDHFHGYWALIRTKVASILGKCPLRTRLLKKYRKRWNDEK